MSENKYTIIPNEFISGDNKLESDKLFLLAILLQGRNSKDICYFNVKYLCKRLNTTTSNTNRTKYIINTLKYFQDNQIFFFSDEPDCSDEVYIEKELNQDKTSIYFAEVYHEINGNFTIIRDQEIKDILNLCEEYKLDKYKTIHMYLYILSFISENKQDETYKLSYPSINKISEVVDISEFTVLKYINILKEQNILYYDCVGYKIVNGKYKMTNTYYCRTEDKELLDTFIQNKKHDKGVTAMTKKDKNKTNQKRSLKQKINKLCNRKNKTNEEMELLEQLTKEYEEL